MVYMRDLVESVQMEFVREWEKRASRDKKDFPLSVHKAKALLEAFEKGEDIEVGEFHNFNDVEVV